MNNSLSEMFSLDFSLFLVLFREPETQPGGRRGLWSDAGHDGTKRMNDANVGLFNANLRLCDTSLFFVVIFLHF